MPVWLEKFLPILILLGVIAIVLTRLPKVQLGHTDAFRRRRVQNWIPVGLMYAFFYMGRYNLTVSKSVFEKLTDVAGGSMMGNDDFGLIFGIGTAVYGSAFLINGPLTDRIGGKRAVLIGATGIIFSNLALGWVATSAVEGTLTDIRLTFSILYAVNMYFQSFGAVSIVKINAPWFHVRERGVFGAIFGILISLGIYFAFDVGHMIMDAAPVQWVFYTPALLLLVTIVAVVTLVHDTPGQAGHDDFDTADASSGDDGPRLPAKAVFKKMLTNPVILTIAAIEFCSGFLRQAIMQWYRTFARATEQADTFVYDNWGMLLCCAGILGGVFAGSISDHVFGSRRGPVAAVLYGLMVLGALGLSVSLGVPIALGALVVFMSMCVIGVHGMLSGTASMDFGGKKNVGVAVGIIDGFVYAGTAVMAFTYGSILPKDGVQTTVDDWTLWPVVMIPVAVVGLVLARRVWHAKPQGKKRSG